ncbi:hypothetical protein BX616_009951, partial [Lobosporangium transversale]
MNTTTSPDISGNDPQQLSYEYDEQATVCAIETFAEHCTEAQTFSVATLASCAITALEASHVDTLPWKHAFLRSLFRHLGIHSRQEQEMLLLLQENGSYQDCNLQVLAEPLMPITHFSNNFGPQPEPGQGQGKRSFESSGVSSSVSSPPTSPTKPRRSLQQQRIYGANSVSSPPTSPTHGSFQGQSHHNADQNVEIDIRTEIINDLLYIGLGFEPSSKSRKQVPIQTLAQDLAGLELDVDLNKSSSSHQYQHHQQRQQQVQSSDLYTIGATDLEPLQPYQQPQNDSPPPNLAPRQIIQHHQQDQLYHEELLGVTPPQLPPRAPSNNSGSSSSSSPSLSSLKTKSPSNTAAKGRVQPLEYDARARAVIFKMCNYLLLSYDTFMTVEKRIAQHLYFYQQELIDAEKRELKRQEDEKR